MPGGTVAIAAGPAVSAIVARVRLSFDWVIASCRLLAQIRRGVRADAAVRGRPHRDRDPPRAEDRRAAAHARGAAAPRSSRPGTSTRPSRRRSTTSRAHGVRPVGSPTSDPAEHDALPARGARAPSRSSCSTTAATSSSAGSRRRTTRSSAAPRRRPPAGCGSSRCASSIDAAGARDQRQPDQAVRREHARGRPGHGRVVPPDHEPLDERQARHGLRLRRRRPGRRRPLPERVRRGLGRRGRPGDAARGAARRLRRPRQGRRARARRRRHHRHRRRGRARRRRPAAPRATASILLNVGHFPREIDVPALAGRGRRTRTHPATGSRPSSSTAAARCTCSRAATWSTSPARARSGTRSSRWTSASRSRRAASRPSPAATSAPPTASSPSPARSTPRSRRAYVDARRRVSFDGVSEPPSTSTQPCRRAAPGASSAWPPRRLVVPPAPLRRVRPRRLLRLLAEPARASSTPPRPVTRIVQSFEPGEDWFWSYADDAYYDGPELAPPHSHPADQPTPGPAGRVPAGLDAPPQLTRAAACRSGSSACGRRRPPSARAASRAGSARSSSRRRCATW